MGDRAPLAEWRDALRDSGLDTTPKAVGWTIATYAKDGRAFPSKATIAAGASLSCRLVERHDRDCAARTVAARHDGVGCTCTPVSTRGSTRSVDLAVNRLEEAGFLKVSRSKGRSSN